MPSCPQPTEDRRILGFTLPEPERPADLPVNARWLSGEGAGSWFVIVRAGENFLVKRFSQKGKLECKEIFSVINDSSFDPGRPNKLDHISNCKKVRVIQDGTGIDIMKYPGGNHRESVQDGRYYNSAV